MATVKKNIMLSSFSEKEKKDMTKKIKQLNGNCLSTPFYQSDCDVIVCRKLNRGEKFLCGCAAGKPLVIEDYVNKSVKAMKWLDPDPFQWSKQPKSVTKGYDQTLIQLPMKCLTHYKDGKGGIFSHWNVLLHVNSLNKLQAYRRLLIAGGAKIMRCKPPFPLSLKNQLTHVFCSREELGDLIALHRDGFHEIWHPEYIAEYLVLHPDNGPTVERFKHNFKTKGQGTPKKGTPKKSGTPKRPTPKRSKRPILTEEQMKNQRRITDMFSQKRKLEAIEENQTSASGRTSPKRPCLNSLDNSVMARTPQKFQPTLYTIVHSKIKQEAQSPAPPLNASISSAANKSTDVISLLSDDDDGEENIKPPSTVKRNINEVEKWRLEKLLSQVADEPIPDGDVLGSIEVLGDFIPVNANQAIKDASKDLKSIKNENKLPTTTTATSDNELPQALTKSANKKKTTLSCSKVLFNNGTDDTPLTRRCIGMSHNFNSTPYFDNKNNKPLIIDLDTPVTERCMKSEFSDLMNESKPIIPVISLSDTPERLSPKSIIEIAGTPPVSEPTNQKTSQIPRKTELTNGNAATPSRGKNEPISVFDDDCIEMKNVHPPSGDTRASSTSTKITISLSDSDLDNIIKPEVAQIVDRLVASTEANTQSLVRSTFTSVKNTKTLNEQAESLSEAPLQNVRTSSRQRTIRKYPSDEYIVPKKREVFQQAKGSVSSDVNTNNNNEVFLESQPSLEQDEKPKTKKPKKRTKVPVLKIPKIPQENSRTSSRERKVRKYPSDEYVVPKRRGTAPGD
uniref:BRCT domain-containing protein n=2 Tax=Clytia hemisphaerica TaxID=252671 RepID=A0A7M5WSZ0_9CNID